MGRLINTTFRTLLFLFGLANGSGVTVCGLFFDFSATHMVISTAYDCTSIPSLNQFTSLTSIAISHTKATSLPPLDQLTSLTHLLVPNNRLTSLPALPSSLIAITASANPWPCPVPDYSSVQFDDYASAKCTQNVCGQDYVFTATSIDRATVSCTSISSLDLFYDLVTLNLQNNQLTSLPSLDHLINLEKLYLQNNQLTSLPSLDSLTRLTHLYVFDNQLSSLPSLDQLTRLRFMFVHLNQLTSLPSLDQLTQLRYLNIRHNLLTSLPSLDQLTKLQIFYLINNQLITLPSLDQLTSLTTMSARNNPWHCPRPDYAWVETNDYSHADQTCECMMHANTDYFGNDLLVTSAATPDECCSACSDQAYCQAWTHYGTGCWLKYDIPAAGSRTGFTSGLRDGN